MLKRHDQQPLKCPLSWKKKRRYERPVLGDRVQMDTCKIAPKLYQYMAIEVEALYDPSKERIQHQNYRVDLELRTLKASL